MLTTKDIRVAIEKSKLSREEKDTLWDYYVEEHVKITQEALRRLDKVRDWRMQQLENLQQKALRKIK